MTENEEFYKLTFSQREGKVPLPEPMRLEYVSEEFRNFVWLAVDKAIGQEWIVDEDYREGYYCENPSMYQIVYDYTVKVLHWPHDHIENSPSEHHDLLRKTILENDYDLVLTLVEFILRHNGCLPHLQKNLEDAFKEVSLAYAIQTIKGLPTIIPCFSEESSTATQKAIETIEQNGPAGAKTHLHDAAKAINEKRYADAVRESIHAVESVARTIDPNAGKALGPALTSLEEAGVLNHPSLREGFKKLYGYTSDKQGIRHALLEEGAADVDLDDAVFMFGACASFAAYLVNRHKQLTNYSVAVRSERKTHLLPKS